MEPGAGENELANLGIGSADCEGRSREKSFGPEPKSIQVHRKSPKITFSNDGYARNLFWAV